MNDLAAQLARTTTATYEQAQTLIDKATQLGLDPERIVLHSPDDPLTMLEFHCSGAARADILQAGIEVRR